MNRPPEIPINRFQLTLLLNEQQKEDYQFLLVEGVFCARCGGIAQKGIEVSDIHLTSLNDLLVKGTCKVCQGPVARTMEFGEDQAFYDKAMEFRKAIR